MEELILGAVGLSFWVAVGCLILVNEKRRVDKAINEIRKIKLK